MPGDRGVSLEAPLPNLLVPIDLRDGVPTEPSLFALSEGRRVAHDAGVTVFAVVLCDPRSDEEIDRIAARLGLAGADKVLLCEAPGLDAPALDATHGPALHTAAERVPPLLVLFPAGGAGLQLGPPLAVRLGAAFAAAADVEVAETPLPLTDSVGRVCLRRWRRDLSAYRRLDPVEMERPVIAILGAQGVSRDLGTETVEVELIACPAAPAHPIVELDSVPDGEAAIPLARVVVLVPAEAAPEAVARLNASAPPGVAIAQLGRVSPATLAAVTPRILLGVQSNASVVAASPGTRVGVILRATEETPVVARADAVWRCAGETPWDELVAALPALAAASRETPRR